MSVTSGDGTAQARIQAKAGRGLSGAVWRSLHSLSAAFSGVIDSISNALGACTWEGSR